jgi:hypothetical protein
MGWRALHHPLADRTTVISLITRPLRLIALIAIIGIGVGGYLLWTGARSSTPSDQSGALADYRALGVTDTTPSPGVPAPGVYRFSVTGEESAGSGALTVSRRLPAEAIYIISPIPAGYHEDLRLSKEHIEEARYRVGDGAATALWRRTKVSFLGIGTDDRTDVVPPAVDHPTRFTVGDSWGGRYSLGSLAVEYRGTVASKGSATLDGTRVPIVVLRTESTFTGATPGTRTDVVGWSPKHSLPVTWTISQKTGGTSDFEITADLRLESATPLR